MKKTIILFLMTTLMIVSLITITLAASYNVKITLKDATSANIKQGEIITFVIKLNNIDAGDGIGAINGKFVYDTNVFEEIKPADIVAGNGWGSILYNDQNDSRGEFVTERAAGDFVSEDNDLMEITAKVKENAVLGKTEIKITNICASNGEDIEIADVKAAITIVDEEGNSVNNNTISNNTTVNNSTNKTNNVKNNVNNVNNISKNNVNNTPTNGSANKDIPKTGIEECFIPSIVILIATAFISYTQYKKVKGV